MRRILVLGAGGFGRETIEAIRAINRVTPTWDLVGVLDDDAARRGTRVDGVPVIGGIDSGTCRQADQIVVTIGNPDNFTVRHRVVHALGLPRERYATIIHPAASIPPPAEVGPGTVILAGVVATTSVRIGGHVAVMPGVILTHDDVVGEFATLASGVHLAGGVEIGPGAYIGAGALIREDRRVGPWALVGMGSHVTRDIPARQVWVGAPARYLRPVRVLPANFAVT